MTDEPYGTGKKQSFFSYTRALFIESVENIIKERSPVELEELKSYLLIKTRARPERIKEVIDSLYIAKMITIEPIDNTINKFIVTWIGEKDGL